MHPSRFRFPLSLNLTRCLCLLVFLPVRPFAARRPARLIHEYLVWVRLANTFKSNSHVIFGERIAKKLIIEVLTPS